MEFRCPVPEVPYPSLQNILFSYLCFLVIAIKERVVNGLAILAKHNPRRSILIVRNPRPSPNPAIRMNLFLVGVVDDVFDPLIHDSDVVRTLASVLNVFRPEEALSTGLSGEVDGRLSRICGRRSGRRALFMVDSHAMDRLFASFATVILLNLTAWPVFAQEGGNSREGDPFAALPSAREERAPNLLPGNGRVEADGEGNPKGWSPKRWQGSENWKSELANEGRKEELCFKISSGEPTDSCWISEEIEVKPNTRYDFSARIRTENVETEDGAKGAVVGVLPMREYTKSVKSTNDWRWVYGRFETGDHDKVEIMLLLGGEGRAKGTVWFSDISLRESRRSSQFGGREESAGDPSPPPPPAYRRPSFDDPVFSPEGLTLDRDQVLALAENIATIVVGFSDRPEVADPVFQAHALGIALRLDPRNRLAVIANGQLDQGQKLKPTGEHSHLDKYWKELDKWAELLHAEDSTTDDKALGLYLGDLARRMRPDAGFAGQFALAHPGGLNSAWARIVPPPPPVQPKTPEVAENTTPKPEPPENGGEPEPPRVEPTLRDRGTENERYKIPDRFPLLTASLFVPVQTNGSESRAALRKVTLSFRDYHMRSFWDDGGEKKRRVPHTNQGWTYLNFDDKWDRLRDAWNERVQPMLDRRYEGWPKGGAVDVEIPDYRGSSGSNAALAVAICFEAMARGLTLDPKVAAVGTWGPENEFRTHSHLPGIVLGYAKEWPEILIVGPGSLPDLERVAATGLITPFLCTQIIEVPTFGEAVALASGQASPEVMASLETYRTIMALRTKMEPGALVQNRHVIEKLREVSAANPKHLSAALLLKASESYKPLDFKASAEIISRLFKSLEQLAESDLQWVTPEEGLKAIEIFNERMREFKPRLDRGLGRHLTRLDDCTRALSEAARLRERKSGTAVNRVENARTQVRAFRQNLDLATTAGR